MKADPLPLDALRAALEADDDADAALRRVRQKPWLDSRDPDQALTLAGADLTPDPLAPDDFVVVHGAAVVIYWGLQTQQGPTRVAGLVWPVVGQPARLLRAIVLPP